MPERTAYEPGTPSWVDLGASDVAGAKAFYGELFGWQAEDAGPVEQTGGYAFFTLNGRKVAGVGPLQGEGQPTAWSTYVSSDDLDGVAQRAEAAGATVMVPPMEIMDAGRMAVFAHPAAGMIGVWEPGRHIGAEIVNDPGSLSWNELHTRDLEGAKAFGAAVFGWAADEQDFGGTPYTIIRVGEHGVGGMVPMQPGVPDAVPAFWMTTFAVDDCDAAVARVEQLGGAVSVPPTDAPGVGRFAIVADPQGAQFGMIENA